MRIVYIVYDFFYVHDVSFFDGFILWLVTKSKGTLYARPRAIIRADTSCPRNHSGKLLSVTGMQIPLHVSLESRFLYARLDL
jgi:hypothetical protein